MNNHDSRLPNNVSASHVMKVTNLQVEQLAEIGSFIKAASGLDALIERLNQAFSGLDFRCVLTRRGWYRIGGVLSADGERISDNLAAWVEQESGGDPAVVWDNYEHSGYIATRLNGQTHYLVASCGAGAADFIQLEVEQLQEARDRLIVGSDWLPDSLGELIDPLDYPRLAPEPVGSPSYHLRRILPVSAYLDKLGRQSESNMPIQRFFSDWESGSAGEQGPLCEHWVMNLREYSDAYGEPVIEIRPMSTFTGELAALDPEASSRGASLANLIHGFDRLLAYPMAWYFYLLTRKKVSPRIAEAIHNDLMGAYDYLPARDLKVLKGWMANPYSV